MFDPDTGVRFVNAIEIKLKDGVDFKRQGPKPTLDEPTELLLRNRVTLNWYPKIQAQQSRELHATADIAVLDECSFEDKHLAFMDSEHSEPFHDQGEQR